MLRAIAISFFLACAILALVCVRAENPLLLESVLEKERQNETIAIELPKAKEEKAPEPEAMKPSEDPLAALAPESLSTNAGLMDSGFGAGYGSGGPSFGSGSGTGGTAALVQDKTSVDRQARAVFRSPLDYPSEARAKGVTGEVLLRVRINQGGAIEEVQIAKAEPPGIFEEAALRAVRSWRFEPAFVRGKTVTSWILQKIRFEMN